MNVRDKGLRRVKIATTGLAAAGIAGSLGFAGLAWADHNASKSDSATTGSTSDDTTGKDTTGPTGTTGPTSPAKPKGGSADTKPDDGWPNNGPAVSDGGDGGGQATSGGS